MDQIPKIHKNSCRARFIIVFKLCSIKQLSKSIASAVKLIYNQIESFHEKANFLSNHNKFWVLQNCGRINETLNNTNKRKTAKCISTYDFSTFYTKLPLNKLLDVFFQPIDFSRWFQNFRQSQR